jgi:hypothetical protein
MPGADGTSINGLLVEASRTNVLIHSQDFPDVSWANFIAGVGTNPSKGGADTDTSPLGDVTAEKVTFNGTGASDSSGLSQTVLSAAAYSMCGWARGNGTTGSGTFDICMDNASTATCASCSYVLGSWAYCKLENVTSRVSGKSYVGNLSSLNGGTTRAAQTPTLWGFQAEAGTTCSSYIATTTASVTRASERADLPITWAAGTTAGFSMASTLITPSALPGAGQGVWAVIIDNNAPGTAGLSANYVWPFYNGSGLTVDATGSASAAASYGTGLTPSLSTSVRFVEYHTGALLNGCVAGTCAAGVASTWNSVAAQRIRIGAVNASDNNVANGVVKLVCLDPSSSRCR